MTDPPVVVIGAGIGGLTAALALASRGIEVVVLERSQQPGGKMREIEVGGTAIDSGPTVFTMRWVFEEIFEDAGASFGDYVKARPVEVLARHAWSADERLDLFVDRERSAAAISELAGPAEGRHYLAFCEQAQRTFETLDAPFIRSQRPTPIGLAHRTASAGVSGLLHIKPFATMWTALRSTFRDPRLQQLFGRYATYCGSSPFLAPATLTLIAHVEREGVWLIEGGMYRLATALRDLAAARGVVFRFSETVRELEVAGDRVHSVVCESGERLDCAAVICNAEPAALSAGLFGHELRRAVPETSTSQRSLSAVTWSMEAPTAGFPLLRHNVFFSRDYRREFDDIFQRRCLPTEPTVYVCAQDRDGRDSTPPARTERLFCLINAPAVGDTHTFATEEVDRCATQVFQALERCGLQLTLDPERMVVTTPNDFERLFPATGGALYGQASHGWRASFTRPGSRTKIRGLYLAGGGVHPGAGVPMAAISGRLAAQSLLSDRDSIARSSRAAMPGGTSMP